MYKALKNISKIILPRRILFKHERIFRFPFYIFYAGSKYRCNICSKGLRKFKKSGVDQMCPSCGSLMRNRRLWDLISKRFNQDNISVLDFSPSRNLFREFRKGDVHYTASDLSGDFISDVSFDITHIAAPDAKYNLIICYHVLEHVNEDEKAMQELYRVLDEKGSCIIQTPFKDGAIYEDYSIVDEAERAIHFGQEDHVRIYSVSGLKARLKSAGFKVEVLNFTEKDLNYYGFSASETILVCTK